MNTHFEGLKVFNDHGYPAVYLPDHPLARKHGVVRVHQVMAFRMYGDAVKGKHVHHLDGDKWNWDPSNISLLSVQEHLAEHKQQRGAIRVVVVCSTCGVVFDRGRSHILRAKNSFCSLSCAQQHQRRVFWPDIQSLIDTIEALGFEEVGRALGVSGNAVRKHIKNNLR